MELQYIYIYFTLGIFWTAWLEWFTTRRQLGPDWDNQQRFNHVFFWPLIVAVFLYYLFFDSE